MYDLSGKVALVTGAAGALGLGRAIALRLAEEGADLIINDLDDDIGHRSGLQQVASEIQALGRRALPLYADVSSAQEVARMTAAALDEFSHIDILVNNAAAPPGPDRVPVIQLEEAAFDLVQRVNLKGSFLCSQAVARCMIDRGEGGRIINMASIMAIRGRQNFAAYSASKFALRGFTQSLAHELAPHGITVNAICPGLVDTERFEDQITVQTPLGMSRAQYRLGRIAGVIAGTPLGRMTESMDIAKMAAFLASDEAAFITGASYVIDGGGIML